MRTDPPRLLFLFADAGGGHRSAAEAIIEAIHLDYGDLFKIEMIDIYKQYGPPPINLFSNIYPIMVKSPLLWKSWFRFTNSQQTVQRGMKFLWPYIRRKVERLVNEHPCDLFIAVHPGATDAIIRLHGQNPPPFITVVTDLISTHAVWFHPEVPLCLVPTEAARQKALQFGLREDQVRVVGLPVADKFCKPAKDKTGLRLKLGWAPERPVVLIVGGGEGMGPIEAIALAISKQCPQVSLVIVTGRNVSLRKRLESHTWSIPVYVYGFTQEMPDFMGAADILVTKAGPGTVTEAFNAGLPLVIFNYLPGQEEGNLIHVVSENAGVYAPQPDQTATAVQNWIEKPELRIQAADASHRLANPSSARQIAHILAEQVGIRNS